MPYCGRDVQRRMQVRRYARAVRVLLADIPRYCELAWKCYRTRMNRYAVWAPVALAVIVTGVAYGFWWSSPDQYWQRDHRRMGPEEEAFRREIMQQLTSRLCAEEIEQIREEARPVTSVNQTVYVDRDMTPSEYNRALRWGQWEGEQKAKRQEQENRLRWAIVRVAHGLTKTEMTVLCGPQP